MSQRTSSETAGSYGLPVKLQENTIITRKQHDHVAGVGGEKEREAGDDWGDCVFQAGCCHRGGGWANGCARDAGGRGAALQQATASTTLEGIMSRVSLACCVYKRGRTAPSSRLFDVECFVSKSCSLQRTSLHVDETEGRSGEGDRDTHQPRHMTLC